MWSERLILVFIWRHFENKQWVFVPSFLVEEYDREHWNLIPNLLLMTVFIWKCQENQCKLMAVTLLPFFFDNMAAMASSWQSNYSNLGEWPLITFNHVLKRFFFKLSQVVLLKGSANKNRKSQIILILLFRRNGRH